MAGLRASAALAVLLLAGVASGECISMFRYRSRTLGGCRARCRLHEDPPGPAPCALGACTHSRTPSKPLLTLTHGSPLHVAHLQLRLLVLKPPHPPQRLPTPSRPLRCVFMVYMLSGWAPTSAVQPSSTAKRKSSPKVHTSKHPPSAVSLANCLRCVSTTRQREKNNHPPTYPIRTLTRVTPHPPRAQPHRSSCSATRTSPGSQSWPRLQACAPFWIRLSLAPPYLHRPTRCVDSWGGACMNLAPPYWAGVSDCRGKVSTLICRHAITTQLHPSTPVTTNQPHHTTPHRTQAIKKAMDSMNLKAEDMGAAERQLLVDRIVGYHVVTQGNVMAKAIKNGAQLVRWCVQWG